MLYKSQPVDIPQNRPDRAELGLSRSVVFLDALRFTTTPCNHSRTKQKPDTMPEKGKSKHARRGNEQRRECQGFARNLRRYEFGHCSFVSIRVHSSLE